MRLDEISPQDTMKLNLKNWKTVDDILYFLKSSGYKNIGSGSFASVWIPLNKKGKIVKIVPYGDICWRHYITAIKKYPNNPHFPKIQSLIIRDNKPFLISIIEELNSFYSIHELLDNINTMKELENYIGYVFWDKKAYEEEDVTPQDVVRNNIRYLKDTKLYQQRWSNKSDEEIITDIFKHINFEPYIEAINVVLEVIKNASCFIDIGYSNVMIRPSTNELVITDPIAG